jgi:hypothetical protein
MSGEEGQPEMVEGMNPFGGIMVAARNVEEGSQLGQTIGLDSRNCLKKVVCDSRKLGRSTKKNIKYSELMN